MCPVSPNESASLGYPKRLLLVGISVRMLAQSCARAGIAALSLDWFADTDTASSSQCCHTVIKANRFDFDLERLIMLAECLAPSDGNSAMVYGGGLDNRPALLERLAHGRILFGNSPDTLHLLKTPAHFFGLLNHLDIPHPPSLLNGSATDLDPADWLVKHRSSEGGVGVTSLGSDGVLPTDCYLQRRLGGHAHSLLFLADGNDIECVGFNRLLITRQRPHQPFLFAGAISPPNLTSRQRLEVHSHALALTRALQLIGLNSLDFIPEESRCAVLEINPRPSATLGLHDQNYRRGLLAAQIDACRGRLTRPDRAPKTPRGFRIVYADCDITVPHSVSWPEWVSDRPTGGTPVAAGNPICSVVAEETTLPSLERQLFFREREIRALLMF